MTNALVYAQFFVTTTSSLSCIVVGHRHATKSYNAQVVKLHTRALSKFLLLPRITPNKCVAFWRLVLLNAPQTHYASSRCVSCMCLRLLIRFLRVLLFLFLFAFTPLVVYFWSLRDLSLCFVGVHSSNVMATLLRVNIILWRLCW